MFRVPTQRFGTTRQVFTVDDPRKSGYKGEVEEAVNLDYDLEAIHSWPDGTEMPAPCLGRSRENAKHYKVFKYRRDLDAARYEFIPGTTFVCGSWLEFARLPLDPPNPEQVDEEDWYNYLDKVDDEARQLNKRSPWPEAPKDASRDSVAEWVAKQHFITDTTIREIWYMPQGAPADEIRFLEISERVTEHEEKLTPFDFRVDAFGSKFRVLVADLGGDQLNEIKSDPAALPAGWTLEKSVTWRRRAR